MTHTYGRHARKGSQRVDTKSSSAFDHACGRQARKVTHDLSRAAAERILDTYHLDAFALMRYTAVHPQYTRHITAGGDPDGGYSILHRRAFRLVLWNDGSVIVLCCAILPYAAYHRTDAFGDV